MVVWGGRQRPRYSPEGWPDMTPRDSPLLIWVGNSEQAVRRETDHFRFISRTVRADPGRLRKMANFDIGGKKIVSLYECFLVQNVKEQS